MGTRIVAALASNLGGRVERRARLRGTAVAVLFPLQAACAATRASSNHAAKSARSASDRWR